MELAPHPLGGRRAKLVNSSGTPSSDRATTARAIEDTRKQMRFSLEGEATRLKEERDKELALLAQPWDVAEGSGIDVIRALRERMPRDEVAAYASTIAAIHDGPRERKSTPDLRLFDLEWADKWSKVSLWTDPAFVPFAEEGGNHLGLFAHPGALATNIPAAVVFRFHEHDPVFAWVAESAEHFVRMIDAAARGDDVEALRGKKHDVVVSLLEQIQKDDAYEDVERKDVHALFWSGDRKLELAAAERLEARYRDRLWTYPFASIEAQRLMATYQTKIDAIWSKLK
jgi:hypothetical protein